MDRKSTIIVILCFACIGLWTFVLVPKLYPPKLVPAGAMRTTNAPGPSFPPSSLGPAPTSSVAPAVVEAAAQAPSLVVATNVREQLLELTNGNVRYTFTSYGGGLKEVELLVRPEKKTRPALVATLNHTAPAPVLALLDRQGTQGDGIFTLTRTNNAVRAEKALTNGLTIVKEFELSSNYLVDAVVRIENRSGHALELPEQEWVTGTAAPLAAGESPIYAGIYWYDGAKATDIGAGYFSDRGFACTPRIPPAHYLAGASNVVWVAAHSQYFALAAMPQLPGAAVIVRKVQLPQFTGEAARLMAIDATPPVGYEAALVYPPTTLTNNQSLERRIFLYAGPKEYQTLARIGDRFNNNLDLLMSFGWTGFVSKALLVGMNALHNVLGLGYGWAVVAITILIKLVFWPLTQASTRSMKRMQVLQPQVKLLQEKYKEDPIKLQKKTMELWKEHKVSPMSGCLPTLIQIPVFFGFYTMIRSAIELRGASFLWASDLSQPDTLFIIPGLGTLPIFGIHGVGLPLNLLPLLMGASMLWQAHLTPPSPGMDPAQAKLMRYLPLIFMLGLYNFSSGLTLYWTVNNLLSILQTKLIKTTNAAPAGGPQAPVLTPAPKKRK